jgi:hypothetical protein
MRELHPSPAHWAAQAREPDSPALCRGPGGGHATGPGATGRRGGSPQGPVATYDQAGERPGGTPAGSSTIHADVVQRSARRPVEGECRFESGRWRRQFSPALLELSGFARRPQAGDRGFKFRTARSPTRAWHSSVLCGRSRRPASCDRGRMVQAAAFQAALCGFDSRRSLQVCCLATARHSEGWRKWQSRWSRKPWPGLQAGRGSNPLPSAPARIMLAVPHSSPHHADLDEPAVKQVLSESPPRRSPLG